MQLNPSDPYTLHGYADCMLLKGRNDESLELVRKMQMVDPFSRAHNRIYSVHLMMTRRYDEAVAESFRLEERFPDFPMHGLRAMLYWTQGRRAKAIEEKRLDFEHKKDEVLLNALDEGLASSGPIGAWRAIGEVGEASYESQFIDPFEIAVDFTFAGMHDEAFYWLERSIERGSPLIMYLPFWAGIDELKEDPRYARLLQLAGLSEFAR